MTRHFLSAADVSSAELYALLDAADEMRRTRARSQHLAGRTVALIFEKPSTRTRVSFEVGVAELGGQPIVLSGGDLQLGRGETIEDTARVLSRYCQGIVLRTFEQNRLERLAAAGTIPVINALSDTEHPCQAVADLQTIRLRRGSLEGTHLVFVGDGNNVAHSLLLAGALAGMRVTVATPKGYEPDPAVVARAGELGGAAAVTNEPLEAADGADVIYTDVWASMGQEAEAEGRHRDFAGFQVDDELVERAASDVIVMHCLPAHRGEEIAASVIDGPRSVVWDQAENRLHAQKALMAWLLG